MKHLVKWRLAVLGAALIGIGLSWLAGGQPVAAACWANQAHSVVVVRPTRVAFSQLPAPVQQALTAKQPTVGQADATR